MVAVGKVTCRITWSRVFCRGLSTHPMVVPVYVAHFLSTLLDKMSWGPNFNRTWCPDDVKTVGHQACRKQNPWLWTKQLNLKVDITDDQSWKSYCKVASDHEFAVGWTIQPTKKSIVCFDHALDMATYFSQNMVSLWSRCTGQHVCLFCAEPRLEFCWEITTGLSSTP